MQESPATRASLLVRLRDGGDSEAWQEFVHLYAPIIYGFARKRGLQDADAADVAQDVLKQVSQSIRGFVYDQEKGRFRDWLRTVARNKVLRFLRQRQRCARIAHLESGMAFDQQVMERGYVSGQGGQQRMGRGACPMSMSTATEGAASGCTRLQRVR